MLKISPFLELPVVLILGACAHVPTGPSVVVMPGSEKSFEQFRQDDALCRSYASTAIGQASGQAATGDIAQERYDITYVQCMYAKGNRVPVPAGYSGWAAPNEPPPPPPGHGMGPPQQGGSSPPTPR
jgi:hypothetical protein